MVPDSLLVLVGTIPQARKLVKARTVSVEKASLERKASGSDDPSRGEHPSCASRKRLKQASLLPGWISVAHCRALKPRRTPQYDAHGSRMGQ